MKRKIYDKLLQWKNESADKYALLVEGARRVGKSWIVEEFAKTEYPAYLMINFKYAGSDVKETQPQYPDPAPDLAVSDPGYDRHDIRQYRRYLHPGSFHCHAQRGKAGILFSG